MTPRCALVALAALLLLAGRGVEAPTAAIKVDQTGYLPSAPKIAFVASGAQAFTSFSIRTTDGRVVFTGRPAPPREDADSGDRIQALDFTEVRETGVFAVDVPGAGRSWPFRIAPDVYDHAFYLAMRAFYGQRCGTAVDLGPGYPGYRHAACHLTAAYHPSSGARGPAPSHGGWHDAGDYGRYVVNSGIATGALLWAAEMFGDRALGVTLDIPESHGATPDILAEIRWNVEWMASMQDRDGGVWQKETSAAFAPFVMPEADHAVSQIIGTGAAPFKSSCATADAAAVFAISARAFKPYDAPFATRMRTAAQHAWTWLDAHPSVPFRNPAGVTTGEYGDADCRDERLWAAAELWRTTHDRRYDGYVQLNYSEFLQTIRPVGPPSWNNVAALALWTYAVADGSARAVVGEIDRRTTHAADAIVARASLTGYRTSLTTADYVWGSNGVAANYGMQLLIANARHPDPRYVATALDDLHYLLGRNTFSLSWVTGAGAHAVQHPHHRPSVADANGEPWPGLLAGGPNRHRQDPAMARMPELPPARMYLDDSASYATNEVAINWNAPLVFLLAGVLGR